MFEYFPENYVWSLATVSAVGLGGAISEIEEACRGLKEGSIRNDKCAQEAWFEGWKKVAERVEALALANEEAGEELSVGRKYLRASIYYLMAERMLPSRDPRKVETYRRGLAAFRKGVQFRKDPVEWVIVPFQHSRESLSRASFSKMLRIIWAIGKGGVKMRQVAGEKCDTRVINI